MSFDAIMGATLRRVTEKPPDPESAKPPVGAEGLADGQRSEERIQPSTGSVVVKPSALAPELDNIPAELRAIPRWLCWKYHFHRDRQKWIKLPIDANTRKAAKANDPTSWSDFDTARAAYELIGGVDGVGFVFNGDGIVGGDFDKCLDPVTGELSQAARDAVATVAGYWELSPSGKGLHFITRAELAKAYKDDKQGIELYKTARYFTVTGRALGGAASELPAEPVNLAPLIERHFSTKIAAATPAKVVPRTDGGDFFRRVNDTAMQSFGAWVPELFPTARVHGDGYRVSSADLGRDLEEDLAIHPEGIKDFGVHDMGDARGGKRTPIDLVMEYKPDGIKDPLSAALWLCEQMSLEPAALGYRVGSAARRLDLRTTKNGIIADEENVLRIIQRDPELMGLVRWDEFKGERILARPLSIDEVSGVVAERGIPRPWMDADTVALQTYIQTHYLPRISRDRIEGVLDLHARRHCAFHPVREYLQGLSWDGTGRLNTWLQLYLGASKQPVDYLAAVGSKFLISAVARIMEPGCQVDSAIVLEGAQGTFKSTALRTLASDPYFSDSLPADLSNKDARDHLRAKWIIELSELAQFKRGEIETIKAFLSRRVEQYRPSYGRHEISFPRQCVFAGTTNADEYLVDQTGNRRFWTVACGLIDLPALKRDRDQLWAEATARYRNGEAWHLSGHVAELAATEAQARVAHDPWTNDVLSVLDGWQLTEVSPGEILKQLNVPQEAQHARNAGRVGQILQEIGWKRSRRDRARGQLYTGTLPSNALSVADLVVG